MTHRHTALLALTLALTAGCADAQTYYQPAPVYYESSPGVYAQVAPTYYAPAYPPAAAPAVTQRNPRLYRALELLSEPQLLLGRQPYPGYTPTPHPFLDASPNIANLIFLGLVGVNSTGLGIASFVIPPALRALRVGLYGTPYALTRRETRLWVLYPSLVQYSRQKYATGFYFERPVYQRLGMSQPLFPRLHQPGTDFLGRAR